MSATSPPSSTAARRVAVLALLVAFVLAQTLGWMHRGLHGGNDAFGSPPGVGLSFSHGATEEQAASGLGSLFGSHADASDCRLFDAVAQPGCAPSPVVVPALFVPTAFLLAGHGDVVARWSAPFEARAPPPSR